MNEYNELLDYLQEEHNEVFHSWANMKEQLDIYAKAKEVQREQEQLERKKPEILELANWCDVNRKWLDSLSTGSDNIKAIQLSVERMVEAVYDGNLSLVGTYKTAIKGIGSNIPELHVVGYLKDGRRVITPFNHCWNHSHGDDVKFDSNAEYDWGEEE
tara:strand:- start:1415 stop:1888 length:474 start_codon:yes stop_codon:yes gene_type:complete